MATHSSILAWRIPRMEEPDWLQLQVTERQTPPSTHYLTVNLRLHWGLPGTCFKIGKGARQGCVLSPCLFNFYAENITWNAGLGEAQMGIKIARRNINNLRCADDPTLMAETEEELRSLLMKVKEDSGQIWLKTQHSKNWDHGILSHHFTLTRRGNNGDSDRLYFGGLQKSLQMVTAAMKLKDAYSLEE